MFILFISVPTQTIGYILFPLSFYLCVIHFCIKGGCVQIQIIERVGRESVLKWKFGEVWWLCIAWSKGGKNSSQNIEKSKDRTFEKVNNYTSLGVWSILWDNVKYLYHKINDLKFYRRGYSNSTVLEYLYTLHFNYLLSL